MGLAGVFTGPFPNAAEVMENDGDDVSDCRLVPNVSSA